MAEFPLEEAIRGKNVEVEWMPFELRPDPAPTLRPEDDYLKNAWRTSVYPLAARMGIEIRLPTISPQPHTRRAFEGLAFAKEQGRGNVYNSRVLRGFFQQNRDIGDIDVLAEIAGESGLDPARFRTALETGHFSEQHQSALRHVYETAGVTGVPLFVIGGRRLSGLQPREALEDAILAMR
ncbi:MAG TPA: DsbA family protein [Bryobacteraceae bacterium]|nr:DsbA family protein [Bryobacteraceae bacterium]